MAQTEPKQEPKQIPKQVAKPEPKPESIQEPKQVAKPEPTLELIQEPKQVAEPEPKQESKQEPKQVAKPEPKLEEVKPNEFYTVRCAIIGHQTVGKSSLVERYGMGKFEEGSLPETMFSGYVEKENIIIGNKSIRLVMLDTPGASALLTTIKLNKQAFVFLLFDVSNKSTFENIKDFVENFNTNNHNDYRLLYILGNKTDKTIR